MEPWLRELEAGRPDRAWDLFLETYRRLVFATIRHLVEDHDDVMDVFTHVCEGLREDDFHRLRAYSAAGGARARFSTWLVVVVRNLAVDWIRGRRGRRRDPAAAESLSPLQRSIFGEIFVARRGHVEAYEVLRSRMGSGFTFRSYLKELADTYRALSGTVGPATGLRVEADQGVVDPPPDGAHRAGVRRILDRALAELAPEDRAAVLMYVIDDLPAAETARVLGLPGPKAVYNRVYRALAALRAALEDAGLSREDL